MHAAIPHLIDVQAIDQQIAALKADLESLPKRIQEADAKLAGARAEVAAAKEAHLNNAKERKKLELDVAQWKERARKYREQTAAVKTNEAYKALLHEIANAEAEAGKAEDAELAIMMTADDLDRRVKSAEARLREAETLIAAERDQIKARGVDEKKQLEAALARRQQAIAPVPEDMRVLYDRIAKRHHGTALARVRDDQCKGCGLRVLPHVIQALQLDTNEEVYRCESCGLILYTLEPILANPTSESGNAAAPAAS
jgi:predicted  nucleic acid-binding Zn-ribbon protein